MSQHPGDETLMMRALALAERARGLTSPNPLVGALVVKDGVVVGEGYHARAGAPPARPAAGPRARGATLYLTLEPCVHQGRTPPCVPALLEAGLRRVVVAVLDPNRRLNRAFFTWVTERRPFVTLKVAMSLDGKISSWNRASRWITGEEARREAHRLRSEADAIVVGIGTVLADDPELTVRLDPPWQREPYRVIVDSHGRTPPPPGPPLSPRPSGGGGAVPGHCGQSRANAALGPSPLGGEPRENPHRRHRIRRRRTGDGSRATRRPGADAPRP